MSTISLVEKFEYTKSLVNQLEPCIRVLTLLPEIDGDDMITCTLAVHKFDESCPEYEALSYVWGDGSDLRSIHCDGKTFTVTANLYAALLALRTNQPRMLWIDQITINQHDNTEKTQQVANMRDIYRRSQNTIAWLGHDSTIVGKAIPTIERFAHDFKYLLSNVHKFEKSRTAAGNFGLNISIKISKDPKTTLGVNAPSTTEVEAVNLLLQNSWFKRVWILQEAAVSKTLVLQVGDRTIPFDLVLVGIMTLSTLNFSIRWSIKRIQNIRLLTTIAKLRQDYLSANTDDLNIASLIYACSFSEATDDRDRFYALYGLCSTPLSSIGLVADYSMSSSRALGQAFVTILRLDNSLRLLELTERSSDSDFPSWIPSARKRSDPKVYPLSTFQSFDVAAEEDPFISATEHMFGEEIKTQHPNLDWQALRKESTEHALLSRNVDIRIPSPISKVFVELEDNNTLCLHGQRLDYIVEVSGLALMPGSNGLEFGSLDEDGDWLKVTEEVRNRTRPTSWKDHKEFWRLGARHLKKQIDGPKDILNVITAMDNMVVHQTHTKYYKDQNAVLEGYRRTLCAGRAQQPTDENARADGSDAEASREGSVIAFNNWCKTSEPVRQIDRLKRLFGSSKPAGGTSVIATAVLTHVSHDVAAYMFKSKALSALYGRRLAWTEKGHLALVPAKTVVGDQIHALRGSHTPFVLRAYGSKWRMLGPTYVDGMMDGELFEDGAWGILKIV